MSVVEGKTRKPGTFEFDLASSGHAPHDIAHVSEVARRKPKFVVDRESHAAIQKQT